MSEAELGRWTNRVERRLGDLERQDMPRWTYLTSPLTSTSWDGDSFSTTSKTKIDLSSVFGVPAYVKAVLIKIALRDSGAAANDCYITLSPNDVAYEGAMGTRCLPVDDRWTMETGVCPCDANGDIYYQIVASGSSTFDVILQIWGYAI